MRRKVAPQPHSPDMTGSNDRVSTNRRLAERLTDSSVFREFQQVFEAATALPLTLRAVESFQLAHAHSRKQNGFCALMSQSNNSCSACLQLQQRVCDGVNGVPCTLGCSFGLHETAVGVKIGKEIVFYLQTGQVFFKPPTTGQTKRALQQISKWGLDLDRAEATKHYKATPVVPKIEYQACVKLLQFFADQLGTLASQIVFRQKNAEPPQITHAREFIEDQYREKLTLAAVASQVNMSRFYFCKEFKKIIGVNFTEYLSRFRLEKAKNLLLNPNFRISEIAYEVGFQSLTHFNRAFKNVAGESPTEYRKHLPNA
jgi:AraC-like DNA-binding protein